MTHTIKFSSAQIEAITKKIAAMVCATEEAKEMLTVVLSIKGEESTSAEFVRFVKMILAAYNLQPDLVSIGLVE